MSYCAGCGTELKNCGAPIWEDYCPNKECHYEAEQFKARMRKAGDEMRRKKALEDAAPDLYEALEDAIHLLQMAGYSTVEHRTALAKARGETL